MHGLAAALHAELIEPSAVVILLPRKNWWMLWCAIEAKYKHVMLFDGRGATPDHFQYMGFTFKPLDEKK